MNLLITGGTGFIGQPLTRTLLEHHSVTVWCRNPTRVVDGARAITALDDYGEGTPDAIINLAGENIAARRWSAARKAALRASRIDTTAALGHWLSTRAAPPSVLISGSAIGVYGLSAGDDPVTESDTGDASFSSTLCRDWEQAAERACPEGTRLCLLRTGIVLGDGGALAKMLPPFRLGLGGVIGSGSHWMPWIHIDDIVALIVYLLSDERASGPINAVAPTPVTNRDFTKALGAVLKRPTVFPMPGPVVKALFGEMGDELLLHGRRVLPASATALGFRFRFGTLEPALRDLLG
ncbi:MAG: TIGR01777 family oxidoreductase [Pseudomonadota bacterium]